MWAVRRIGGHAWLVLERDPRGSGVFFDRVIVLVPGFAAVGGSAHEQSVARGVVRPVIFCPQLIEAQVGDDRGPFGVIGRRHIAGALVVGGFGVVGNGPGGAAI